MSYDNLCGIRKQKTFGYPYLLIYRSPLSLIHCHVSVTVGFWSLSRLWLGTEKYKYHKTNGWLDKLMWPTYLLHNLYEQVKMGLIRSSHLLVRRLHQQLIVEYCIYTIPWNWDEKQQSKEMFLYMSVKPALKGTSI